MILTDNWITVTIAMMQTAELFRTPFLFGVPVDPVDLSKGVVWKDYNNLSQDDYNAIERYFLNLKDLENENKSI